MITSDGVLVGNVGRVKVEGAISRPPPQELTRVRVNWRKSLCCIGLGP